MSRCGEVGDHANLLRRHERAVAIARQEKEEQRGEMRERAPAMHVDLWRLW
jgi:hypothetical protein